jgi:DNA-binding Lrp family transcriptional regulator
MVASKTKGKLAQLLVAGYKQVDASKKLGISKSTASGHVKALIDEKVIKKIGYGTYEKSVNYPKFGGPEGRAEPIYWNAIQLLSKIRGLPKQERLRWQDKPTPNGVLHSFTTIYLPIDGHEVRVGLQKSIGPKTQTIVYRLPNEVLYAKNREDTNNHLQYFIKVGEAVRKFLCRNCGYDLGLVEYCIDPEGEIEASELKGVITSYSQVSPEEWFDMTGFWPKEMEIPMEGTRDPDYLGDRIETMSETRTLSGKLTSIELLLSNVLQVQKRQVDIQGQTAEAIVGIQKVLSELTSLTKPEKKLTKDLEESSQMYG